MIYSFCRCGCLPIEVKLLWASSLLVTPMLLIDQSEKGSMFTMAAFQLDNNRFIHLQEDCHSQIMGGHSQIMGGGHSQIIRGGDH